MGYRSELAQHLRDNLGQLQAEFDVAVYDAGAEIIAVPAVVLFPDSPYQSVATQGPEKRINVTLSLVLVANRADPTAALDQLEDLRKLTTDALRGFKPTTTWATFGDFGATEIGGTEYATAAISLIAMDSDRGATA